MAITPRAALTRAVAVDVLSTALVAADMQKVTVRKIAVFRDPNLKTYIEITGEPLHWPNLDDGKQARAAVAKRVRDCTLVVLDSVCKP